MAQAMFSVRMDESLKQQFDKLCTEFGMNMSTAINVFARAVVREKKIPFEIVASSSELTRKDVINAFEELRAQAQKSSAKGMTIEEIDAEIRKTRYGGEN